MKFTPIRQVALLSLGLTLGWHPPALARTTLPLNGEWRLRLDPAGEGVTQAWFNRELPGRIQLPGTTDEAHQGNGNTNLNQTRMLSRPYPYWGKAWYQRAITVPNAWQNKRVVLELERSKRSQVWLDGRHVGAQDSLATTQTFDLTDHITPGKHQLTVLVENGRFPGGGGHQLAEDTQTDWNGILGRLQLKVTDKVWLDEVQTYPNASNHLVRVRMTFGNLSGPPVGGQATLSAASWNSPVVHRVPPRTVGFQNASHGEAIEVELDLGPDAQLWDEFSPALYKLRVELETRVEGKASTDAVEVNFGLREFKAKGTQFCINGRATLLRGKHDACVFPLTGYPPMDVAGWLRGFKIAKDYGINHYRFHSWTPPRAAFEAADIAGIYMQPELYNFGGDLSKDSVRAEYTRSEGKRILREFGNHPSFVMFALGNEMGGGREARAAIVKEFRKADARRLYAQASNYDLGAPEFATGDDYWTTFRTRRGAEGNVRGSYAHVDSPLGHVQAGPPAPMADYARAIESVPVPVIGHEIGQYQVYPNFREMAKYTGVLQPWNFGVFQQRLAAQGMLDQADDFVKASGALALLCYREEIEAALRTKGFGGFQLLDLQDFPGQGTALVGMLDAFMDSKGLIEPAQWREFCSETVPLALMPKYVWTQDEVLQAEVKVAHYGPRDIPGAIITWEVREETTGHPIRSGKLKPVDLPTGALVSCGRFETSLKTANAPARHLLTLRIEGTVMQNRYPVWVYPTKSTTAAPAGVWVSREWDAATRSALAAGKPVLLIPLPHQLHHGIPGFFAGDFWCYPMFKHGQPPGTLGLLCNPRHPALAQFPTAMHSDWQWFHLVTNSCALILDETPASLRPIVQVIDNFDQPRNHKLGLIFEAKIGPGRLLVCSSDLPGMADRPEAQQLLASLLQYAASPQFLPSEVLTVQTLDSLFARPPANLALGKPAAASGSETQRGNTPDKANDGNEQTRWCAPDEAAGYWWQVDLQAPKNLTGARIVWEQNQVYQFSMEGSTDGQTWQMLADQRLNRRRSAVSELAFSSRGMRFARITVTGLPKPPPTVFASIKEVAIWGKE